MKQTKKHRAKIAEARANEEKRQSKRIGWTIGVLLIATVCLVSYDWLKVTLLYNHATATVIGRPFVHTIDTTKIPKPYSILFHANDYTISNAYLIMHDGKEEITFSELLFAKDEFPYTVEIITPRDSSTYSETIRIIK